MLSHNPEVVGSSPASATIKKTGIHANSGLFLYFLQRFRGAENPAGVYLGVYGEYKVFSKSNRSKSKAGSSDITGATKI